MNQSNFISINWKEAKSLLETGVFTTVGSSFGQLNNQGEFTISKDQTKIYKRRHTASKAIYDLIAQKKLR